MTVRPSGLVVLLIVSFATLLQAQAPTASAAAAPPEILFRNVRIFLRWWQYVQWWTAGA